MSRDDLPELLQQLQNLRLQGQQLLDTIDQIVDAVPPTPPRANTTSPVISRTPTVNLPDNTVRCPYRSGDRVRIINKIRQSNGANITEADRLATVIFIAGDRIHLVTDNNRRTWRVAKNLVRIL
jgi:hypothetical protein